MDVDVRSVPLREAGMVPAEIMTSESQERMLAIVEPGDLDAVLAVCRRWEVLATVVGTVTTGGRLRILDGPGGPDGSGSKVLADVPAATLHDDAPRYRRPIDAPTDLAARRADDPDRLPTPPDCGADLLAMLADTSWVWSQYDHQLFLNTVEGPGGDAAVLRLKAPGLPRSSRAMALTTDSNSRWCALDPRTGTGLLVAEGVLNVACTGARPLAVVNCLNFGNPEHPEVMWQLSEAVDGLAGTCRALGVPVVGGNVSLYNSSDGVDIDPTPVIGVLGVIDELVRRPPGAGLVDGGELLVLGDLPPVEGALAGSRWAEAAHGHRGGVLTALDAVRHAALCELVRGLAVDGAVGGVHDVSDGGLGLALAEMAVRTHIGFEVAVEGGHAGLFSEAPSRVVVCVAADLVQEVTDRAHGAGVTVTRLGRTGGDRLIVNGMVDVSVAEAVSAFTDALPTRLQLVDT
jgi:phosphoribosylformylglycinamidine synthase